jgi:hypothetical protein
VENITLDSSPLTYTFKEKLRLIKNLSGSRSTGYTAGRAEI